MENRNPILRFGIISDGKRSSCWRVRAGMAKPELFMEREGYGKKTGSSHRSVGVLRV